VTKIVLLSINYSLPLPMPLTIYIKMKNVEKQLLVALITSAWRASIKRIMVGEVS